MMMKEKRVGEEDMMSEGGRGEETVQKRWSCCGHNEEEQEKEDILDESYGHNQTVFT